MNDIERLTAALNRIRELADFRSAGNTDHAATLDRLDSILALVNETLAA